MKTGKQKVIGEINITPLTDVFLVLLIIMIVVNPLLQTTGISTTVSQAGEDSKLESKEEGPGDKPEEEPKVITVNIDAAGAYSIGGEILDNDLIKQRILALKDANPDGILLNVDPIAPLQRMTDIMDFASSAKIEKISLSNSGEAAPKP